jgi:hypothetical protein
MKTMKLFFVLVLTTCISSSYAQTAEEIVNKYLTATGGIDNWKKLEGIKM